MKIDLLRWEELSLDTKEQIVNMELQENQSTLKTIYDIDFNLRFLIISKQEIVIAFLVYKNYEDTNDIYNLIVNEKFRRQGIGTKLLSYLDNKDSTLEVNINNVSAHNLYLKNGYREIRRIPRYYNNKEEAIILQKIKE